MIKFKKTFKKLYTEIRKHLYITMCILFICIGVFYLSCAAVITIVPYYKQEIAKQISLLSDQPVDFSKIKFTWRGFRVYAKVYNLEVGNANSDIHIEHINHVDLLIHPIKSLINLQPKFDRITIHGGKVFLNYKADLTNNLTLDNSINLKTYLNNIFNNKYLKWLSVHKIYLKNTAVVVSNEKSIKEYLLEDIKLLHSKSNNYIYGLLYKVNNNSIKNKEREKIEFALRFNVNADKSNNNRFYFATNSKDLLNIIHDTIEAKVTNLKYIELDPKTEIKIWGNISNTNYQTFDLANELDFYIDSPRVLFNFNNNNNNNNNKNKNKNNIELTKIKGLITYSPEDYTDNLGKFSLGLIDLKVTLAGSEFKINANIDNHDLTKPAIIDSNIKFGNVDFKKFTTDLPKFIIGENTSNWLDHNIKSGWLRKAQIIWRGNLDDSFPYDIKYDIKHDKPNGVFNLLAEINKVNLSYSQNWPQIDNMDAELTIRGRDLTVRTNKANISNSQVEQLTARINGLGVVENNVLLLTGKLKTSGEDLSKVIATTPLKQNLGEVNNKLNFSGPMGLYLNLSTLLNHDSKTSLRGRLVFNNNNLELKNTSLKFVNFEKLSGNLDFTEHSAFADNLIAEFDHRQTKFSLNYDEYKNNSKNNGLNLKLHSSVDLEYLHKYYNYINNNYIKGITEFDLNLNITKNNLYIDITSDLKGVSTDFPKIYFNGIYNKKDVDVLPIKLNIEHDFDNFTKYSLDFENKSSIIYTDDTRYISNLLVINNQYFDGDIRFIKNNNKFNINADIRNLNLIVDDDYFAKNINTANTIDYFNIPNISAKISSFSFNNSLIGMLVLNTRSDREKKLFSIYDTSINGAMFDFNVKADYKIVDLENNIKHIKPLKQTNLIGTYKVKDLNDTAKLFGNGTVKDKIKFEGDYNLFFQDELLNIELKKLVGDISIKSGRGRISNVELGLGRIFGFFNLMSLDKRLRLDFSDVFEKGFKFDNIKGQFKIKENILSTDSAKIASGSADLELYGSVDLLHRSYDLKVDVTPHVTSSLPVAAAVVGTPVAGAVVFLVDKILESPVDQMSERAYAITGPWREPVITKLKKKRGPWISLSWFKDDVQGRVRQEQDGLELIN